MRKNIARLLFVLAVVAGGTIAVAGAAQADVVQPASGTCTTRTAIHREGNIIYTTVAKVCEGQAKAVCTSSFRTVLISRWPYRITSPVITGYGQCPVADTQRRTLSVR